jgi:3'-phosphoadenosine 5'-phosphosulfate sulfotransferase (PAPS reductase)/FAD synthetase
MIDLINLAVSKGAKIYPNISGGKDSQAMAKMLVNNSFPIEEFIYCDLGKIAWKEGLENCLQLSEEFSIPLRTVRRSDGLGLVDLWRRRAVQLKGTGKPFWSSSASRYCTSDTKRDPADKFYRNCGADFIISCEGIRAQESAARSKKSPLTIRTRITSKYYDGMTPEEAIANFKPGERLALTWLPIFNFSIADVWATYGNTPEDLVNARQLYAATGIVADYWKFNRVYVYGNDRLSCKFCVLASCGDLTNGAKFDSDLLDELIDLEIFGESTFKNGWSLTQLKTA